MSLWNIGKIYTEQELLQKLAEVDNNNDGVVKLDEFLIMMGVETTEITTVPPKYLYLISLLYLDVGELHD